MRDASHKIIVVHISLPRPTYKFVQFMYYSFSKWASIIASAMLFCIVKRANFRLISVCLHNLESSEWSPLLSYHAWGYWVCCNWYRSCYYVQNVDDVVYVSFQLIFPQWCGCFWIKCEHTADRDIYKIVTEVYTLLMDWPDMNAFRFATPCLEIIVQVAS